LHLEFPAPEELASASGPQIERRASKPNGQADEDRRYWEDEDDDGYFGEMEEEGEEDLEEAYRSIY